MDPQGTFHQHAENDVENRSRNDQVDFPVTQNDLLSAQSPSSIGILTTIRLRKSSICSTVIAAVLILFITATPSNETRNLQSLFISGIDSNEADAPPLMWLMNFPDSGGSYTIQTIQHSSGYNTATNNGRYLVNQKGERIADTYASVPIYADRPNGPFIDSTSLPIPKTPQYVVAKTSCGGHCVDCFVEDYVTSRKDFLMECASAVGFTGAQEGSATESKYLKAQYDHRNIEKIVHLARNPFDNIIARFQSEYKFHVSRDNFHFTEKFPFSKEGFNQWCTHLAAKHEVRESDFFLNRYGPEMWNLAKQIPCYSEFFKYIQWHNHATFVSNHLQVPTFVVHYEDYLHRLEPTVQSVLLFSRLPLNANPSRFFYQKFDYFSKSDIVNAQEFMRGLVNEEAYSFLQTYLVNKI